MSENHYAMSSECYQNLKPYLSTRTIPIPLHLWLYLTAVYDQFWVPCLDWPSLYPEQECIYDEEGLLRHDFGEKDVEFTTAQLRDAQELAGDHERAATEAVDDMREQVKGSQKREKHYDLALACFDRKSSYHGLLNDILTGITVAKSRLDANLGVFDTQHSLLFAIDISLCRDL